MVHNEIREWLKKLISDKILSAESEYNSRGLYLKWMDGEISATDSTGQDALNFLRLHIIGD